MTLDEQEAEAFLQTLNTPPAITNTEVGIITNDMDEILENNFNLIEGCNEILRERIRNCDESLTMKDLISAKDTAFKQNQLIMWRATENVNVNINELQEKTPAELLEMLNSLNG